MVKLKRELGSQARSARPPPEEGGHRAEASLSTGLPLSVPGAKTAPGVSPPPGKGKEERKREHAT
jgi:hypothetical protein